MAECSRRRPKPIGHAIRRVDAIREGWMQCGPVGDLLKYGRVGSAVLPSVFMDRSTCAAPNEEQPSSHKSPRHTISATAASAGRRPQQRLRAVAHGQRSARCLRQLLCAGRASLGQRPQHQAACSACPHRCSQRLRFWHGDDRPAPGLWVGKEGAVRATSCKGTTAAAEAGCKLPPTKAAAAAHLPCRSGSHATGMRFQQAQQQGVPRTSGGTCTPISTLLHGCT